MSIRSLLLTQNIQKQSTSSVQDATCIVSCIDSRTTGYGAPEYTPDAGANIIEVASQHNVTKMLHVSVMGGYRWSPTHSTDRLSHMDIRIRRLKVPWTMLRVSCYHDEIEDGHVRPPDGGKPHPFHPSSRYSPVSRADTGRVICNLLPDLIPIGLGCWESKKSLWVKVEQVCSPYRQPSSRRSAYGGLPHGDFSVATSTSEIMVGWVPTETLEWFLDPKSHPLPTDGDHPFWNRPDPKPHWSDQGENDTAIQSLDAGLRFAYTNNSLKHWDTTSILKSTSKSSWIFDTPEIWDTIPAQNIWCVFPSPQECTSEVETGTLYTGNVAFIYDELADDLQIWWQVDEELDIPITSGTNSIWVSVDD